MKKSLFFLIALTTLVKVSALDRFTEDRIHRLELEVDYLTGRVEYLTQLIEYNAIQANEIKNALYINELDGFFREIELSNGSTFSYSAFCEQSIDHWLEGQAVRLDAGSKKGYVKIVNLMTNDWIEAKRLC